MTSTTDNTERQTSSSKNLVLIGMPGCGKTTIGEITAERLGMDFTDIDEYIEVIHGKSIPEIFREGEAAFRRIETEALREVSNKGPKVIATGGGVVTSPLNMDILKQSSVVIFINRPLDHIYKDIDLDSRPLLKGRPEALRELYEKRLPLYREYCDYELDNSGELDDVVERITSIYMNIQKG